MAKSAPVEILFFMLIDLIMHQMYEKTIIFVIIKLQNHEIRE
ncbi:hypothetical protein PARMER_02150 [Parabacteroides merdae ATCC 43184]|nr:hypothetical protein PARMER_02150 [Parabacteroides merdae ATCC 43184]